MLACFPTPSLSISPPTQTSSTSRVRACAVMLCFDHIATAEMSPLSGSHGCACTVRERVSCKAHGVAKSPSACVTPVRETCRPTLQLPSPAKGSASMVCLCESATFHQRAKPSRPAQPTGKPCTPHAVPGRPTGVPARSTHLDSTTCSLSRESLPHINPWLPTVPSQDPQSMHDMRVKCIALSRLRSACRGRCPTHLARLNMHVVLAIWCWPRVICAAAQMCFQKPRQTCRDANAITMCMPYVATCMPYCRAAKPSAPCTALSMQGRPCVHGQQAHLALLSK